MPRKASGQPKTKLVERRQANGDIYVYEVTTLYNPEKRYNEHVSSRLLGKKSPNGAEYLTFTGIHERNLSYITDSHSKRDIN
jgi:hypothetical protein